MNTYTIISLSTSRDEYWRLHRAGCGEIVKEQGTMTNVRADNAKAAASRWIDAELEEMGYTAADVKILNCAK